MKILIDKAATDNACKSPIRLYWTEFPENSIFILYLEYDRDHLRSQQQS